MEEEKQNHIDGYKDISLFKYADDSTVLVTITKDSPDISDIALSKFMDWTVAHGMFVTLVSVRS